ncbi:hypothetical protein [Streptomyces mashuensis]|nr:hypothetical protein [Streptomyces mashuensis]
MAFSADELRVLRRALDIAARDARDCCRLAAAVAEAEREGGRLRAFLRADLDRYRRALPGADAGYLRRLEDALDDGFRPTAEDLTAVRGLCTVAGSEPEAERRRALLRRCERLVAAVAAPRAAGPAPRPDPRPAPAEKPAAPSPAAPSPAPASPSPAAPRPDRPIPTPGEVFPPRRKPAPPPAAGRVRGVSASGAR